MLKSRLILSAAAAAILLGAGPVLVAPTAAIAQASGGVEVPPLGFEKRTLANGLDVYTARDTSTSNVTVQVWYKVGAKDDPEGRSGFAHLFEHLMFKATRNLPPETFDRLTEDVGGSNNASTALDTTFYYETVPAQHLERMLFAEADRMGSLVVNQEVMDSEREVVKEEFRQRVLSPPYGRFQRLYSQAFIYQTSPYRRPGIGSLADLDAATIDDVLRFHETYYRPDNAFLVVAGNFDQAQLDAWIDQYFAPIETPDRPLPANNVAETFGGNGPREATFYGPNVPLTQVQIVYPTVPYEHPDRAALDVLDGILSTGDSSRLHQALVRDSQLATSATSGSSMQQQVGVFSTSATVNDGKDPEAAIAALRAEAARLRDAPVTQAELDESKNELVASALRSRETIDGRTVTFSYSLIMTGDPTAADRDVANIQAVTAADIQRVARQYLVDDRAITMRYMNATDENPESSVIEEFTAPVTLADLAQAGEPVTLAPEGERIPLPEPGQAVEVATPAVAERTLSNGMRVLVAPTRTVPLVSARLSFDAGASEDPDGKAGVASFTAGLLTQGTETMSAEEIATAIEQLGAAVGASSGSDFTNVYANAPSDVFDETFDLMADLVTSPTFPDAELELQRAQTLNGLKVQLAQPGPVASYAASRAVFGGAAYGRPAGGTPSTLPGITPADLAAFHQAYYRPSQATLVFSGDITPDAAFAMAEEAFGDWTDASGAKDGVANPAGPAVPSRIIVIDQPGAGQAAVIGAMRGISRTDDDYFPLLVGNGVLGGGFSARLSTEIRIKRGLSYGAYSSLGVREDAGMLTASAQTRNEAVPEVARLILHELGRLSSETAQEAELDPRQATLNGSFGSQIETVDGLGAAVANLALYGLPMSELAAYTGKVDAVTPAQIQEAAARRLPIANASLVIVGDAATFIEQLREAHPNVEVIPMSEFSLDSATLR